MANYKETKNLILYGIIEGLYDAVIYTVSPEEDLIPIPHMHIGKKERKNKEIKDSLKKRLQKECKSRKTHEP